MTVQSTDASFFPLSTFLLDHRSSVSPNRRDAAKAYKEFEDFFAGDDAASAPRGGIRAGPATSGGRAGFGGGFVKAGGGESCTRNFDGTGS